MVTRTDKTVLAAGEMTGTEKSSYKQWMETCRYFHNYLCAICIPLYRSKRRSRSSQHARVRSILRSLLLDSDKSEEENGRQTLYLIQLIALNLDW